MKKYYLIAVIILLTVSAGLISKYQVQVRPEISVGPSSSPSQTQIINATDQTYISSRFGFSFKYPSDWKTVELADGEAIFLTSQKVQYSVEGGTDDPIITVSIWDVRPITDEYLPRYKKLTINGFEIYRYDSDPGRGIDLAIKFGSKYARIVNHASTPGFDLAKAPEYNAIFENLINSFRLY